MNSADVIAAPLSLFCCLRRYVAAPPEMGAAEGGALDRDNITIVADPADFSIPRHGSEIVMLEHYYTKPATLDRIRACWLGEQIEAHVGRLLTLGYTPKVVFFRVPLLRQFAEFSSRNGVQIVARLPSQVSPFIAERMARSPSETTRSAKRLRQWENETRRPIEQFLGQILPDFLPRDRLPKCTREPFEDTVPGFFGYLRDERGLRPTSIYAYRHALSLFEAYLTRFELATLGELSVPVVSGFVTTIAEKHGTSSTAQICSSIRVLLRYALREGLLSRDLVPALGTPRSYRLSKVPRSISWEDVRRMLDVVDRRSSVGKRDYAILVLLITYGLRAREIAALTLDDIDWERDRLLVPERKCGHCTAYPLSGVVGEAICIYLEQARPETDNRTVFQRAHAPDGPMTFGSVSDRAARYLRKAGIDVRRPGSHTLRHTCVQRLIDADFSLKSAGDFVGHGSPRSTEIYTKIDVENLREVALGDGESLL